MLHRRTSWPSPVVLALAVVSYVLVSVGFTWPLPMRLGSALLGPASSDLGVYVWNLWVFRHEAVAGHFPIYTSTIFSLDAPVDLSLHNYTLFADMLAMPLLPVFGVVATHNVLTLATLVVGATAMFVLAFYLTRRASISWMCGLLFGFSPTLTARSEIHPSLSMAAALPLFVLALLRVEATRSKWWAVGAGVTLAWAALCDPYYGVYCAALAIWFFLAKAVRFRWSPEAWRRGGKAIRALDAAIIAMIAIVGGVALAGGVWFSVGGIPVRLTTLYTPVLILSAITAARIALATRPRVSLRPRVEWAGLLRLVPYGAATAAILLSPVLYALVTRLFDGRYVVAPVYWRTSTPGVDLTTMVMPNPNNVWLGVPWRAWLTGQPGGYAENIASVTVVAIGVIAGAMRFAAFRLPRLWFGLAVMAGSLALGPFLHVAGVNTFVPTPWALARYLPLIGAARSPARFVVLTTLAVTVIFGLALKALADRHASRRRLILWGTAAILLVELCPAPRQLHEGRVPAIYDTIASDARDIRVLELPFGLRDGLSSFGNFSASSQFYQTHHEKRLIGGYLSRVPRRRVDMARRRPVLAALLALSEGRGVTQTEVDAAIALGPQFVETAHLGYVVVDRRRAAPALVNLAVRAMDLEKIGEAGDRELYRPREPGFSAAPIRRSSARFDIAGGLDPGSR